jgi:hypothetical protein
MFRRVADLSRVVPRFDNHRIGLLASPSACHARLIGIAETSGSILPMQPRGNSLACQATRTLFPHSPTVLTGLKFASDVAIIPDTPPQ